MKGTQYTQLMDPYATENAGLSPISTSNYNIGAQVNSCIPAGWWDFLFNNLVTRARQSYNDINVLYSEILNVLSAAGVTPDETVTNQLSASLTAILDAKPLATQNVLGKVKSSGGRSFVSVGSDGTMTANGVGSITSDSNSGITLNPSVVDIVSALNFLTTNISGHEIAIPPKPEAWEIETADMTTGDFPVARGTTGDAVFSARRGTSSYMDLTVPAGWHRICIWGGSGGRGGGCGSASWYGRIGAYGGSSSDNGGSLQSYTAGDAGGAGRTIMLDLYLPTATMFKVLAGGGGNAGGAGGSGNVSSSGDVSSSSGGSAGIRATPVSVPNTTFYKIGTRIPSFLTPVTVGSNGVSGGKGSMSASGSYVSFTGAYAYGGTGGSGGCGGGTMVKFGATVLCASGGDGGAGAGRSSKSGTVYPLGSGYGGSNYSIPSGSGGARGSVQYAAQVRLPFVLGSSARTYFFSPIGVPVLQGSYPDSFVTLRSLVNEDFKVEVLSSETCTLSFKEIIYTEQGQVDSITFTPAYSWTVQSGVNEADGLGGGIAIFKGANT